ncbi:cubilin [Biomphalaria glabrata]|nr:cubilin-like [Biomphalaria glabrata]
MELWKLLYFLLVVRDVCAHKCVPSLYSLTATEDSQTLLSPGYPSDYENNQTCKWIITAQDVTKKIQVEIVSLDLAYWFGSNCEDYLEFRDGNTDDSTLIKRTCTEKIQIKTKGPHLMVTFITDQHFTAPGFALQYYQIHDYKSSCDPFAARTLSVGQNPLFLDLPMFSQTLQRELNCDFHIKSETTDDVAISLELLDYSSIRCHDGNFSIYDGKNNQAPLILEWCYSNQPFQHLTSSGQNLFIHFKLLKTESLWYVFRVKVTIKIKSASCSDKSISNLELTSLPTYFAFPLEYKHKSKKVCPLRLWAANMTQSIRLQVVSKHSSCGNKDVTVYNGYDQAFGIIGTLCEKKIYISSSHNMVLHPVSEDTTETVIIKASSVVSTCSVKVETKKAIHDVIQYLPEVANAVTSYPHDLNCTYLLQAESSSDAVEVKLFGRLVHKGSHKCSGDTITFYNGDSISSPLISTWCGVPSQNRKFTSTGPKMLVNIKTDSFESFEGAKVMYYAVPQAGSCKLVTNLEANSSVQYLTSPNEPMYYPINSYCVYELKAPEGHVVVLNVIKSKMEEDCSDNVQVYDGLEKNAANYLGRWCGEDKPSFRSTGQDMLIIFSADEEFNTGGFNASYFAYKESSSQYLTALIVGVVISVMFLVTVTVIIYIFVIKKRRWVGKV